MAEKKNVTFIRKNGRIIPIRSKGGLKKRKKLLSRRNKKADLAKTQAVVGAGFFGAGVFSHGFLKAVVDKDKRSLNSLNKSIKRLQKNKNKESKTVGSLINKTKRGQFSFNLDNPAERKLREAQIEESSKQIKLYKKQIKESSKKRTVKKIRFDKRFKSARLTSTVVGIGALAIAGNSFNEAIENRYGLGGNSNDKVARRAFVDVATVGVGSAASYYLAKKSGSTKLGRKIREIFKKGADGIFAIK